MFGKKLTEILNKQVNRRQVLRGAVAAAFAATLKLVGLPDPAQAHWRHVACCHLVYPANCPSQDCIEYQWQCYDTGTGTAWKCIECYSNECSLAVNLGIGLTLP